MRRALLLLPLLLATPDLAQPAGAAETLLHINESAEDRAGTGSHWAARHEDGRDRQATQSFASRGPDSAKLPELAGTLQGQGLAMADLRFGLARETHRAAREEASRLTLDALQTRAETVAAQFGLHLVGLREVRIGATGNAVPRAMAASRSHSSGGATPVSVAEYEMVPSTVQTVILPRPR